MTFPPGAGGGVTVSVEGHRTAQGLRSAGAELGGSSSLGTPSQQNGQKEPLEPCGPAAPHRALCRHPQAPSSDPLTLVLGELQEAGLQVGGWGSTGHAVSRPGYQGAHWSTPWARGLRP